MTDRHGATNCQWATPTLLLQPPLWLEASGRPWSCLRDAGPFILDTTEICATCPRWEPQRQSGHVVACSDGYGPNVVG